MNIFIGFRRAPRYFTDPEEIISCYEDAALPRAFAEIERALSRGYYVAGFLSYEAGYFFEERLREHTRYDFPLLCMGVYRTPRIIQPSLPKPSSCSVSDFSLNISRETYGMHIDAIRSHIAAGDVYQITYCIKFRFKVHGPPLGLYPRLLRAQAVPYPAFIERGDFSIISLSPERFLEKQGSRILTEPMKGTWQRGNTIISDLVARQRFWGDIKNRAENIMIADLLRNDLGRVATRIRAPKLFTVAQYRTLFQMTSTVTGRVPKHIPWYDLCAALFPSGSVTGAPRIRAMEIIRSLETEPRHIYTGAIGYIAPTRDLYFNIPIRTLLIRGARGEMGVGGGIVWDSTAQGEWEEGILKARFLTGDWRA